MPTNSKLKRDKRITAARKMAARIMNFMGYQRTHRPSDGFLNEKHHNESMVRRDLINRMTNWQRNQWGRAGHPMTIDALKHYVSMPHHKQARAA